MSTATLTLPPIYRKEDAEDPRFEVSDVSAVQTAALDWAKQNGLKNIGKDKNKVSLLVIDDQDSFSFPTGSLFVGGQSGRGAMEDQDRLVRFIYQNIGLLSEVICTLDTHVPYQIFFQSAHLLADGSLPIPMAEPVTGDLYRRGVYRANPAMCAQLNASYTWLGKQYQFYIDEVEKKRLPLMIWPYHGILGSAGHRLAGVLDQARLFHSFARGAFNIPKTKGGNPFTENYSIFGPEVMTFFDGTPIPGAQKNTDLMEKLTQSDMLILTGQAKSHCLAWSIRDLLDWILVQDRKLAEKVYLLEDCTSPVVVPGVVDFTDDANKAVAEFQNAGLNVVQSTVPMKDWPGIAGRIAA